VYFQMIGREDYQIEKKIHKGTTTKPREVQVLEVSFVDDLEPSDLTGR
jgi:hypothetical protein